MIQLFTACTLLVLAAGDPVTQSWEEVVRAAQAYDRTLNEEPDKGILAQLVPAVKITQTLGKSKSKVFTLTEHIARRVVEQRLTTLRGKDYYAGYLFETLLRELVEHKWRREKNSLTYVAVPPEGDTSKPTRVTLGRTGKHYLIVSIETSAVVPDD